MCAYSAYIVRTLGVWAESATDWAGIELRWIFVVHTSMLVPHYLDRLISQRQLSFSCLSDQGRALCNIPLVPLW
jgi:hypothetical protein